jgi:hypothetical protein
MGQITLSVQFSTTNHYCIDYVNFIVSDFEGTYHAILGRSALAKFVVVPHYVYLLLKMPTEQGVLTLRGNVFMAYNYETESFIAAEALELSNRMESIDNAKKIPLEELDISSNKIAHAAKKTKEHKKVQLVLGDNSKMALIRPDLDPK